MRGLPLNHQLSSRGGRFLREDRTADAYRLFALPGAGVRRPGLVRQDGGGTSIAIEIWELTPQALGELIGDVPPPLAIGNVQLADSSWTAGFVCEGYATGAAEDVSDLGGWRAYLTRQG
jgi:allophanate hydrolase